MGLADIARHVIRRHRTQEARVQNALNDVAGNICQALIDTAHHVIGLLLTQEPMAQIAFDDMAGDIWQALLRGVSQRRGGVMHVQPRVGNA
jgi:hypothetical protein